MQHWSELDHHLGEPCPVERNRHAAVCLNYAGDCPQLLVIGGLGTGNKALSDVWMLNLQSGMWREVRVYAYGVCMQVGWCFVCVCVCGGGGGGGGCNAMPLDKMHLSLHVVNLSVGYYVGLLCRSMFQVSSQDSTIVLLPSVSVQG